MKIWLKGMNPAEFRQETIQKSDRLLTKHRVTHTHQTPKDKLMHLLRRQAGTQKRGCHATVDLLPVVNATYTLRGCKNCIIPCQWSIIHTKSYMWIVNSLHTAGSLNTGYAANATLHQLTAHCRIPKYRLCCQCNTTPTHCHWQDARKCNTAQCTKPEAHSLPSAGSLTNYE